MPCFPPRTIRQLASRFAGFVLAIRLLTDSATAAIPTFSTPIAGRAPDPAFSTAIAPVIAKLDGDNVNDFVTANAAGTSVFISFGNADGSAKSSFTLTGPANPVAIAAADINGDGKQDIVVASEHTIRYFLNDGMAPFPFSASVDVASPDVRIVSLALADFNQDSYPDLLVSGDGDNGMGTTVGFVQSFLSTVDGGNNFLAYGAPTKYNGRETAARMAVGDLNGDGYPDVVLAQTSPAQVNGDVTVSFGNPSGFTTNFLNTLQPPVSLTEHHPVSIAIGDITQDGKADILVSSYTYPPNGRSLVLSFVDVLRNLDDSMTAPTFRAGEYFYFDYGADFTPPFSDVEIADVDGDGVSDIAAIQSLGVGLHVIRVSPVLDENSMYQSLRQDAEDVFAVNTGPNGFALGLLNDDTYPDVVVAHAQSGGMTTLLNTTPITEAGPIAKMIQFDLGAYTANEGFPAPVDVIVKRAADSTGSVTMKFTVGGTATPNGSPKSDFALADPPPDKPPLKPKQNTATLTFGPGEFEKHITLFISQDAGSEPDETIILSLQTPTGDAVLGTPRVATVTIKDSEPPALRGGNKLAVKPSKPLPLIPADKLLGVKVAGRTPDPWTFTTSETKDAKAAGLAIKVQYSLTAPPNDVWVDLPDGNMSRPGNKGTKWVATSLKVPDAPAVRFRTVSSATNITSGNGPATAPCRAVASPVIRLSIKAEPAGHVSTNTTTYPEESIQYKISYENVSTVPATNVVVGARIPGGTHSDNGNGSSGILFLTNDSGERIAAYFNVGTVPPGGTGTCRVDVNVDADLLSGKPPKTPLRVGFASSRTIIFTDLNSFAKLRPQPVYGAICDDPLPAKKPKALSFGGPEVSTPVNQPIEITCVADKTIVELDDTITYTVMLHNYSSLNLQNVVYRNSMPLGTAFESAHDSDGNGNFNQSPPRSDWTPTTNPGLSPFRFGVLERTLKWTIPLLPAGATREIKFTVRTLADSIVAYKDKDGVLHTPEIVNRFYDVTAVTTSGRSFRLVSLQQGEKPSRSLLSGSKADQQPQLGLNKEVQGTGKGRGELRGEHDGTKLIPSDVETVLPGDDLEYTVHFWNTGDQAHPIVSTARNCVIQEELAEDVIFHGGMKIFGIPIPIPDSRFVFRDKKGVVLPYPGHTLTQDFKAVRIIETRFGDLSPNNVSKFSYLATPTVAVGKFIYSRDCRIWTTSLSAVKYNKQQVVAKVVKPITFSKKVTRDKTDPVPAGELLKYTVLIRNNGGVQASNVRVKVPIPPGTTFQAGTAVTNDVRVPVAVAETTKSGRTSELTFTIASLHASEATSIPDANNPDTASMSFTVKLADPFPLPPGAAEGAFDIMASVKGQYASGATAFRLLGLVGAAAATPMIEVDGGSDFVTTRVRNGPMGPSLWALKQYPQYVTPGQKMVYTIVCGNSGTAAVQKVRVGMIIPKGTVLDKGNTTGGYAPIAGQPFNKLFWEVGDLAPHDSRTFFVVLDMLKDAAYPRDTLTENSCAVDSDSVFFDGKKIVQMNVVPGPASTNVFSDHPVVGAWQAFCAMLQSWGANLFGKGNAQIEEGVKQFGDGSINTTLRGADVIALESGAIYVQNGGGSIVAAGGGNLIAGPSVSRAGGGRIVAGGGGNIVAGGGGNIVAAGGGNIVAAGGGNLISVQGIGFCTQANVLAKIQNIVAGGGGNIVAAGGGNLVRINGGIASLVGQDGASLRDGSNALITIDRIGTGLLDGGGGNFIVSGGGHVFSPGDFDPGAPLVAGKKGAAVVVNGLGKGTVSVFTNPAMAVASVVANDGAGVVANDGAGVISDKGAGAFANDPASLVGQDGASLVGQDGASFIPDGAASFLPVPQ